MPYKPARLMADRMASRATQPLVSPLHGGAAQNRPPKASRSSRGGSSTRECGHHLWDTLPVLTAHG